MAQIIDSTLDREVESLSDAKVVAAYIRYKAVIGEEHLADEDAKRDQISAAHNLLYNSLVPYCDFSVWGPHGRSILKKSKCRGLVLQGDGTFKEVEIAGPADFEVWDACRRVMATALLCSKSRAPR